RPARGTRHYLRAAAPLPCGCADIARARPCRFRRHDLVFALGTGGGFSPHPPERPTRGRPGPWAAPSPTAERRKPPPRESHESGRGHPLHAERDRPLDADDHAIGRRAVAPKAGSGKEDKPMMGLRCGARARASVCTLACVVLFAFAWAAAVAQSAPDYA